MATYSGLILAGTPHPNSDGFLYNREPHRLWVSENSRAALCLDTPTQAIIDGRKRQTIWIPRRPNSILEDALLMVAVMVLKDKNIKSHMLEILDCDELPLRIDLTKVVTDEQHRNLIALSRKNSEGYFIKLILACFHGSSITCQVPILEKYAFDVEVLVPGYTRLYSRWLKSTVIQGDINDLPTIENEKVTRH